VSCEEIYRVVPEPVEQDVHPSGLRHVGPQLVDLPHAIHPIVAADPAGNLAYRS